MIEHLKSYNSRTIFLCMFTIAGLVSSRAVMSIGTIALFVNILLAGNYSYTIKKFFSNKALFAISFLFFASLFSLLFSSKPSIGLQFVINKLPLIVMPLALSRFEKFKAIHLYILLVFFIMVSFVSSSVVMFHYFQHFSTENTKLVSGHAIWVPLNHIRYSLVLTFAFICSSFLYIKDKDFNFIKFFKIKYLFLFIAIYLFIVIHIIAIRSAILTLYVSIFISLVYYMFQTKKYKLFSLFLAIFITIPILAYYNLESFENKINYMKYDWEQYLKNKIGSNSDARRLRSFKVGIAMAKKSFPFGCGAGDTKPEINEFYNSNYPSVSERNRLSPHNQFLYTLIDYGVLGLFALCITLFYPFYYLKNKRHKLLYYLFWTIFFIPLLYDISLEMQLGITFFALFSALLIKYISDYENELVNVN